MEADDDRTPIEIRETGHFLAILSRQRCSLALSTRPNRLVMIGTEDSRPVVSQCHFYRFFRPMGLGCDGNRIAIATLNELFVFANVASIAKDLPDRPDYYDAVFVPRSMFFTGTCDLHDMVLDGPRVVAVNTRYSCVCVIDGQYNFTPIWRPPFITEFAPEDRCHLNGMAFAGRAVRYVTMLGLSNEARGWRDGMAEGGVLMEVPSGRVVAAGLSMPHSPRLFGGRLYVLEGGRGLLLGIDAVSGEKHRLAKLPGFAHGLAEHGGVLFVGMSKLRDSRGPRHLPIEAEGRDLIAGVAAIDMASGDILGSIEFLNAVEELYDVQVLPNILRPEIRDPVKWFETMSVVTPNGGFWVSNPLQHGEPDDVGSAI
ncbi:MAG: TIGR03032 family protein [Ancalomicrobiaceae bacterium]|nr:TIGR03032 family protein [Ancalomicrobiaceae bacterium]